MKNISKFYAIILLVAVSLLSGCGSEEIYKGQVSGTTGGSVVADNLTITFPPGIANTAISLVIEKSTEKPEIKGTERQLEAYKHFRFISPIYKVTANPKQFKGFYTLNIKFDPAEFGKLKAGEILHIVSVSDDGVLEFPFVLSSNLKSGQISVMSSHFSNFGVAAAKAEETILFVKEIREKNPTVVTSPPKSGNPPASSTPSPVKNPPATQATSFDAIYKEYVAAKADYDAFKAAFDASKTNPKRPMIIPSGETDPNKIEARYFKAYQAYINATQGK